MCGETGELASAEARINRSGEWAGREQDGATGRFFVNEVNTIPGFTSISMYPKMWEYTGVPYSALLDRLIGLALERHETKKATRYSK